MGEKKKRKKEEGILERDRGSRGEGARPFHPGRSRDFDPDPARTPTKVPDPSKSLKSRSTGCVSTVMLNYDCLHVALLTY
jgi:hypothetical protein